MKIYVLFLSILFFNLHRTEDNEEKTASKILNSDSSLKNSPTRVSTKQDLRDSYNQFMSLENSPDEKAKMDQMMEKLAGIKVGSSDSLASASEITSDKPQKTQIKTEPKTEDDRKLVGDDSILQMSQDMSDGLDDPAISQTGTMKNDLSPQTQDAFKDRKLAFGGGSDMDTGMSTDMADMKNSFDNVNSMGPGEGELDLGSGSDNFSDLDSGMHENATKAIINRMDQNNQESLQKLNSMLTPSPGMMSKPRKKKNRNIISIKKMLKNYPPELVNEFMPELKEKVMHKFNEMRRNSKEERKIRRLKRELEKSKERARKRRKLREKRRRRMLRRRRRRRKRKHHHKRKMHHFRPHFSIKKDSRKHQFHTIRVINKFMHKRHNHLNHLHHRRERRLEETSKNNSGGSDDPYLDLEKELNNELKSQRSQNSMSKGIYIMF